MACRQSSALRSVAAAALVGGTAGTVQGATGVSAHIVAPYYHGRNVPPEAYAFLVAFSFLVFQRLLLVIFVLMEIKLLTDVVSD